MFSEAIKMPKATIYNDLLKSTVLLRNITVSQNLILKTYSCVYIDTHIHRCEQWESHSSSPYAIIRSLHKSITYISNTQICS